MLLAKEIHMAKVKRVQQTTTQNGESVQTNRYETTESSARSAYAQRVVTNLIWFVAGVILVLLAFRFVFSLLGANTSNGFANFIYTTSHPFVAPFFSLFSYNYSYGISHFEIYTLIAMLVYLVVAWGLTALVNIDRR